MNLDFSEDQKLLQKTARDFLAENARRSQVCREVLESARTGIDPSSGRASPRWAGWAP